MTIIDFAKTFLMNLKPCTYLIFYCNLQQCFRCRVKKEQNRKLPYSIIKENLVTLLRE